MISFKHLIFLGIAIALSSFMLLVAGCESASQNSSSSTGDLAISPNSVTVSASVTNEIAFTASGGTAPYTWSLNNPSIGFIVAADDTAVYTAYALTGMNFVVVSDFASNSVSATITQQ